MRPTFRRPSKPKRTTTTQDGSLLESLDSSTKYYYEVTTGNRPARVANLQGHFHTLPSLQDTVSPEANPHGLFNLRFEFACGNNQNPDAGSAYHEALPAYATMRRNLVRDDAESFVDFAILNGDWLYENDDKRRETPAQWAEQNGVDDDHIPRVLKVMPTLAGVWANYKHYLEQGVTFGGLAPLRAFVFHLRRPRDRQRRLRLGRDWTGESAGCVPRHWNQGLVRLSGLVERAARAAGDRVRPGAVRRGQRSNDCPRGQLQLARRGRHPHAQRALGHAGRRRDEGRRR